MAATCLRPEWEEGDGKGHCKVFTMRGEAINTETSLEAFQQIFSFYKNIPTNQRPRRLVLVLDNARYWANEVFDAEIVNWVEEELQIKLVVRYLPPYSPNLSVLDLSCWKQLEDDLIADKRFPKNFYPNVDAAVHQIVRKCKNLSYEYLKSVYFATYRLMWQTFATKGAFVQPSSRLARELRAKENKRDQE